MDSWLEIKQLTNLTNQLLHGTSELKQINEITVSIVESKNNDIQQMLLNRSKMADKLIETGQLSLGVFQCHFLDSYLITTPHYQCFFKSLRISH